MGIIAVVLYGTIWANRPFGVPFWVILICHAAIGLGTAFGGWRLLRTMGHNLTKPQPIRGLSPAPRRRPTPPPPSPPGPPASPTPTTPRAPPPGRAAQGTPAGRLGIAGR